MSRFKRRLKEPFGKAGLTVAILALVMALVGGAYAAGGLTTKQKKEVKSIAKGLVGTGPAGAPGTPGTNGTNGKDGAEGKEGKAGTSVTSSVAPKEPAHCKEGGSKFVAGASTTYACNGTTGFTETLPSGETLKGEWGFATVVESFGLDGQGVSFGIPLEAAPTVVYVKASVSTPTHCTGSVANPGAEAGFLCVFAEREEDVETLGVCDAHSAAITCAGDHGTSADPFGFNVWALAGSPGGLVASGTWAVTAG